MGVGVLIGFVFYSYLLDLLIVILIAKLSSETSANTLAFSQFDMYNLLQLLAVFSFVIRDLKFTSKIVLL